MFPWMPSTFNFPLSGDVNQRIEPDWFFNAIAPGVGDSEIEKEVILNVASYGNQIGMVTDVLLAIADELKLDETKIPPLSELRQLQAKVKAIKSSKRERVKENAKTLLEKLKSSDSEAFKSLIREYEKDL